MADTREGIINRIIGFDAAHYAQTERYAKQVERLFATACQEYAQLGAGAPDSAGDAGFSFDQFPKTRKQAQGIATRLAQRLHAVVEKGQKAEWLAACKKSDAFLGTILHTSRLSKDEVSQYQERNLDALGAFQKRKEGGLGLSQRVWKYVNAFRNEIELGIGVHLGEGKDAQALGRELKQYLKEPNRLYRRVRDKYGNLNLSKAAAAYHPGRGVYRSSARNAQRLARTEINMAYRESEYLRWQALDFVVGMRVCLSNNHTTKDSKGDVVPLTDMCDKLYGDYPKAFKFVGWHPQCRCYVVPIMKDYDEYNRDRAGRLKAIVRKTAYQALPSRRKANHVPQRFRDYIEGISDRAQHWASTPYYIRDNFKGGKISGGLKASIEPPRWKEIIKEFSQKGKREFSLPQFEEKVQVTKKSAKEWVNQPHEHYLEKNELILDIENVIKKATYRGFVPDKHDVSVKAHLYEIEIKGDKSWAIVRELPNGEVKLHSVTDHDTMVKLIGRK